MDGGKEDTTLLSDLRKGDEAAFDSLFKKYYPVLCAYANRFVDLEDAESIVQDLMTWFWENKELVLIESSLGNYLFRSTYNRTLNLIAKKEVERRAAAEFYMKQDELFAEDIHYYQVEELSSKIEEAIRRLPDPYREAFVMHRFQELTYREIASRLKVSSKTVDYRIQQALKQLRIELKDYLPFILILYEELLQ